MAMAMHSFPPTTARFLQKLEHAERYNKADDMHDVEHDEKQTIAGMSHLSIKVLHLSRLVVPMLKLGLGSCIFHFKVFM